MPPTGEVNSPLQHQTAPLPKINLTLTPYPDYILCCPIPLTTVIIALILARCQAKGQALPWRIDGWFSTILLQRLLRTGRRLLESPAFGAVSAHFQSQPWSIPESRE